MLNVLAMYFLSGVIVFFILSNDMIRLTNEDDFTKKMQIKDICIMGIMLFYSPCFLLLLTLKWIVVMFTAFHLDKE